MAKKVSAYIKLQVPAGKATPAPPIGPALGQHGVNIPGFCKVVQDNLVELTHGVVYRFRIIIHACFIALLVDKIADIS